VTAILKRADQSDDVLPVVRVTVADLAENLNLQPPRARHYVVRANELDRDAGVCAGSVAALLVKC
jgi:hypothetical protein